MPAPLKTVAVEVERKWTGVGSVREPNLERFGE